MKSWESMLGTAPPDESCAQIGEDNYHSNAKQEAARYIELLKQVMGPPPKGVEFRVRSAPHDFGTYLEVHVGWEDEDEVGHAYAMSCLNSGPQTWDDIQPVDWRTENGL